ncbi:putative arsenite transmembrane transporter protein [Lizonia empirigonia]|nr:putative arsenite transmembrane transporter protein [Lizonia empirigonia]
MAVDLDTSQIKEWRSIITLVIFILTNFPILRPFRVSMYIPRLFANTFWTCLAALRIAPPRNLSSLDAKHASRKIRTYFVRVSIPVNYVTAPLMASLFLLALGAIGRNEIHAGTMGNDDTGISPYDLVLVFLTLGYIANSIGASGLVRYLVVQVLRRHGKSGRRLFLYLYVCFFGLGMFIGNDPIMILFLAYLTRVTTNVRHSRAWIHTQFSIANIATGVLVSSNPTNLLLAGLFNIKFINYTANMIVPIMVTALLLFPFLLYIFHDESLIPSVIKYHELPEELMNKRPINVNIPYFSGRLPKSNDADSELDRTVTNENDIASILNPFLAKKSAIAGTTVMCSTVIILLALNAVYLSKGGNTDFWVTLPAAVLMCLWDCAATWLERKESRRIAHDGRQHAEKLRAEREERRRWIAHCEDPMPTQPKVGVQRVLTNLRVASSTSETQGSSLHGQKTLYSLLQDKYVWCLETFPTTTIAVTRLPYDIVPFAFCMFILVQALASKGWVPVFGHAWDWWATKSGTVGCIWGMGFLGVVLSNFAGTNIGACILLSRIIQAWQDIHSRSGVPISDRTFWATVYSLSIGVNFGAFSLTISASLTGIMWRTVLNKEHRPVRQLDFARVHLPIIAVSMIIACSVLVAQVYIVRSNQPYNA